MVEKRRLLVIGANGAIGSALVCAAVDEDLNVVATGRGPPDSAFDARASWVTYDPINRDVSAFGRYGPFDAICWAHGANIADSLLDFDRERHLALYEANCLSVMTSLAGMIESDLLVASGARLCVVSSIWQERAKQNKLSYSVTKAAVGGLVRAASVDLGSRRHLINAVLPGVLDTRMTAAQLTPDQIDIVAAKTTAGRLPDLDTVVQTILFLCSSRNNSVTGQSIAVDLGMSNANLC